MSEQVPPTSIQSRVRAWRVMKDLSQQEVAQSVGVSRQALSSIEGGHSIPNTAVALRIAQALDCRVEDLFALPEHTASRAIELVGSSPAQAGRLAVANVRGRWIGYSLAAGREIQEGFVGADGLLAETTAGTYSQLFSSPEQLEQTALLLGCDPSLGILSTHVARHRPDARLRWLGASSQAALDAVVKGEAHIAGSHLRDHESGVYNVPQASRALAFTGGVVVAFARWEQGFVVPPGNPKELRTVADLARPDVRLINREQGSGSRALLDDELAQADIPADAVVGYGRIVGSHLAVARVVAAGGADVGIATRATAQALGLDFVPLAEVQFDFLIPHDHLEHPAVALVCELLQSEALRTELAMLPGYDVTRIGSVVAQVPAA